MSAAVEERPTRSVPTLHSVARLGVTIRPLAKPVDGMRRVSPFRAPWPRTLQEFARELESHGAELTTLEVGLLDADFRADGGPRGDRRVPRTAGVRLTFRAAGLDGSPLLSFDAGEFGEWHENVRALALGLESLRRADRYGITKRGEQYAGFRALPSGGPDPVRGARLIEELGGIGRALRATHPDTRVEGYTDRDFADVQAARKRGAAA